MGAREDPALIEKVLGSMEKWRALTSEFVGRPVQVRAWTTVMEMNGKSYPVDHHEFVVGDAVVDELDRTAEALGLHTRWNLPSWYNTTDWVIRRLNVVVRKLHDDDTHFSIARLYLG